MLRARPALCAQVARWDDRVKVARALVRLSLKNDGRGGYTRTNGVGGGICRARTKACVWPRGVMLTTSWRK